MRRILAGVSLLLSGGCLPGQWAQIGWEKVVAEGLTQPTLATGAGDGSGRLFIVELGGRVRILREGGLVEKPFLDLTSRIGFDTEAGLLSIAFPPKFAERKHFYADFIDAERNVVIARYKVSSDNPDVADPASEEILLTIPQPFGQHNGGMMAFSPVDGMLYISTGDGGIGVITEEEFANDPLDNGQNPGVLLGKILRIDTESGVSPYAVPPDNPKKQGWLPEIWSIGWRNPWRFSFDRATGDFYAGDVGSDDYEEVNYEPAGMGGLNYGWSAREGIHCVWDKPCVERNDLVDPALEYAHGQGCSVTGGVVYRGAKFPELAGTYFYADFCKSTVWAMKRIAGLWQSASMGPSRALAVSFGEDDDGELYLVDHKGALLRMAQIEPGLTISSVGNSASGEPGLAAGSIASAFLTGLPDVTWKS
jgi:glucose/arabinose dehydrogenase